MFWGSVLCLNFEYRGRLIEEQHVEPKLPIFTSLHRARGRLWLPYKSDFFSFLSKQWEIYSFPSSLPVENVAAFRSYQPEPVWDHWEGDRRVHMVSSLRLSCRFLSTFFIGYCVSWLCIFRWCKSLYVSGYLWFLRYVYGYHIIVFFQYLTLYVTAWFFFLSCLMDTILLQLSFFVLLFLFTMISWSNLLSC